MTPKPFRKGSARGAFIEARFFVTMVETNYRNKSHAYRDVYICEELIIFQNLFQSFVKLSKMHYWDAPFGVTCLQLITRIRSL